MNTIRYMTIPCVELSDDQLRECKQLFDDNYGTWDMEADRRPGKQIRFPGSGYEEYRKLPDSYVALARDGEKLVGQAFYIRKTIGEYGVGSWVLQLVVREEYRQRKIAKALLLSIWGFSGDYMWGLATSNALTIKTLESATLRQVDPAEMANNIEPIMMLKQCVPFARDAGIKIETGVSVINSDYPVDRDTIRENRGKYGSKWMLGDLELGQEWLAFTFRKQTPREISWEDFCEYFDISEKVVQDAYNRMPMDKQSWARNAAPEIRQLLNMIPVKSGLAYDIGCGTGRHAFELARSGFKVVGFDYAENQLEKARSAGTDADFLYADCRNLGKLSEQADLILCVYDVIGTFEKAEDNKKIVAGIVENLKPGGYAVISVMNRELTEHMAMYKVERIESHMEELLNLPASSTMQESGDVFDPHLYILDTSTGIVYRKEQFEHDGHLSAEYIIRDKRYTMEEITSLLEMCGLQVEMAQYIRSGHWDIPLAPTDPKAKEILVIAKKPV